MSSVLDRVRQALADERPAVVFTVLEGPRAGAKLFVAEGDAAVGNAPAALADLARELLTRGRGRVIEHAGVVAFADVLTPPPRLLVFGAIDTADALCREARALGWRTIAADARARFATAERLPHADEIIVAWPQDVIAQVRPDPRTAIVVLTHEERFDVPALVGALATDAFYIGALGSRRTQAKRRERLLAEGADERGLHRIMGPCGLDIGAESPTETAVSIMAEILARRAGRAGGSLAVASGRIHAEAEPERDAAGTAAG
jgi:xanthine dehydrogenase accessory factor